ncbi:divalent cation tolerance protein [Erythrobacter litoralis]|jgi:periplasmic divalent cation tolerance protein|uniref:Divalent cation transporter n=1 Tax=Erythrobacter litoralis TaxID=39960 RepID=A0A074NG09_9SPHN|nr:divalent-cation tolerance protein CutA [Erythrobacter litoralis]AOL25035.1 divalent cation tolerance protein [Erythrobacter litoralis]KEO96557.1 divalent cation transporter [Erythrobacter litoralis]MEE4338819.1 divalent-cation tolerance protein CutA [Erythrobacter sp.]
MTAALAYAPFPDRDSAREIAGTLLAERLIACANILAPVESVFEWDGRRTSEEEVGALFKTTSAALAALIERLGELHPYDTPAIIGWHCDAGHPATLEWLGATVAYA